MIDHMGRASQTSPGKIIILNGSSSAGKSTLAAMLQQLLAEPYQCIALDQFRDGMPGRYRGFNSPTGTPGADGLNIVPTTLGDEPVTAIRFGDFGQRVLRGMRRAIAAMAREGVNVIVDDVVLEKSFVEDYAATLAAFDVTIVGVRCAADVVDQRELSRPGRFPGTAAWHFDRVHEHAVYDVEIDTSTHTPRECAELVMAVLDAKPTPTALEQLLKWID